MTQASPTNLYSRYVVYRVPKRVGWVVRWLLGARFLDLSGEPLGSEA